MPHIGDAYRAAREARHLSLSEVSEQLHIRSVYLEGIENEEWSTIGAPVYVRGFMRTYARFLGLEPEAAVAYFNASLDEDGAGFGAAIAGRERSYGRVRARAHRPSPWLWAAALAAALLVGFVGYNAFELRSARPRTVPAKTVLGPAPAASAISRRALATRTMPERAAAGVARSTLEVRLTKASWVSVQIDGTQRLEGTFPAGTRKAFHGKLADVRTGNAGGVELTVNGKALGSMGHPGGVVERSLPLAEE